MYVTLFCLFHIEENGNPVFLNAYEDCPEQGYFYNDLNIGGI